MGLHQTRFCMVLLLCITNSVIPLRHLPYYPHLPPFRHYCLFTACSCSSQKSAFSFTAPQQRLYLCTARTW
uniref:Putative secreted protein n=1 Tax=Anopheles darlingi TaxID=43151 RepID=A0A2M4D0H5_ANODA